jgi:hypothetical protein
MEGIEPRITENFEKKLNVAVNTAMGVMENNICHNKNEVNAPIVNAHVNLVITLELVCGQGGKWDVSWAKAETQAQNKAQNSPLNTGRMDMGHTKPTQVYHRQTWRPKTGTLTSGRATPNVEQPVHSTKPTPNLISKV